MSHLLHCFFCQVGVDQTRVNNGGLAVCVSCEASLTASDDRITGVQFKPSSGPFTHEIRTPLPTLSTVKKLQPCWFCEGSKDACVDVCNLEACKLWEPGSWAEHHELRLPITVRGRTPRPPLLPHPAPQPATR